jgi:hypothetical protein
MSTKESSKESKESKESKPILLICACAKYEVYLRAAIRRFENPAWTIVGIMGGATETTFNEKTRVLTLAVPDTYEALPTKIYAAFSWAANRWPDAPGIFKTDDDIVLMNKNDLVVLIDKHKQQPFWGFVVHNVPAQQVPEWRIQARFTDKTLKPSYPESRYCFGHGYWVSKEALPHILAAKEDYESSFMEDICTGYVLNRQGILPEHTPINYMEAPRVPELLRCR